MFHANDLVQEMDGLRGFAYRLSGNSNDAEDLVQSTVVRALEKKHLFKQDTNLFRWCSKIMFNLFATQYRRRTKFESMYDPEPVIERQSRPANQDCSAEFREVGEAIDKLSAEHREVLLAVCVQGQKYQDVARDLDIPVGTVRSRLSRAREQLHHYLDNHNAIAEKRAA